MLQNFEIAFVLNTNLTLVFLCIASKVATDSQQDATFSIYLL